MERRWFSEDEEDLVGEVLENPGSDTDQLFKTPNGWFFHDETWAHSYGPFEEEGDAQIALVEYMTTGAEVLFYGD